MKKSNKQILTAKTQREIRKFVKTNHFIVNFFGIVSFLLILYGSITESWIRLLSGAMIFLLLMLFVGFTSEKIDEIENKYLKGEKQ